VIAYRQLSASHAVGVVLALLDALVVLHLLDGQATVERHRPRAMQPPKGLAVDARLLRRRVQPFVRLRQLQAQP